MKIAILYICTGKYNQFFKDFYDPAKSISLKDRQTNNILSGQTTCPLQRPPMCI